MRGPVPTRCQRCSGSRLGRILARCSDMCIVDIAGRHLHDYVPRDLGIGGGDDVEFDYCFDCGQIQGEFPLPTTTMEAPPRE
jgi:hypothetical protein